MQVYMILLYPHLFDEPIRIKFPQFLQYSPKISRNAFLEDFSPVSCNPYHMILGFIYNMGLSM